MNGTMADSYSKSIEDLPEEILVNIFSYLPSLTLSRVVIKVCQKWRSIVRDDKLLWKNKWGLVTSTKDIEGFDFPNWTAIRFLFEGPAECLELIAKLNECQNKIKKFEIYQMNLENIEGIFEAITSSSIFENIEHLSFCGIVWLNLEFLTKFRRLKALNIWDCYFLAGANFRLIIDTCKELTVLHLPGCRNLSDYDLAYLFDGLKNTLVDLRVEGTNLKSGFLSISDCSKLERLTVDDARYWDEALLLSVAQHEKLKHLTITRCRLTRNILSTLSLPHVSMTIFIDDCECIERSASELEVNHLSIDINCKRTYDTFPALYTVLGESYQYMS